MPELANLFNLSLGTFHHKPFPMAVPSVQADHTPGPLRRRWVLEKIVILFFRERLENLMTYCQQKGGPKLG